MGSDKNPETVTNTCSSSEPTTGAQDSSNFGDISNLSPVQPFKDASLLQGFPGIISPPNVFTSPHINAQSSFLNRQQQCRTSSSGFSPDNVKLEKTITIPDDPERMISQLNIAVESSDQKGSNATAFTQLQTVDALVAVEALLLLPVDGECIDSRSREHHDDVLKTLESNMAKKDGTMDNCRTSETSMMLFKQADECSQGGFVTGDNQMKDENYQFVSTSEIWSDEKCGDSLNEVNEVISGGVLRRCLQFGEHQHKSTQENPADTTERQISICDLSKKFSPETPCNRHVADQSEFASTMCFSSCTSVAVSKPRGIGLHLNSIVASPPRGLVIGKQSSKGMVKLEGKSLILSGSVHALAKSSDSVERTSSIAEGDMYVSEPVEMVNPNKLPSSNSADALELSVPLSPVCEELGESTEVLNDAGSITGRKQASSSVNPDGCKRCSCKKSKCLKLYCDCFAAGLFCVDSCSCKGCFNRQEFKDTVIEARKQIESRNPLAFAPRIMQHVTNSPTNSGESVESVAPPSLRHKRGCNCRKSMCLKKYCECYQSNVGCSDGCRCDGCKNVYGKKPDYSVSRHIVNKRTFDEISEEIPDQKRKLLITSRSHVSLEKVDDLPVAVPTTSVLSCSDSRKNEMKSLLPGRRYVLSPEPNLRTPPSGIHQSSSRSSVVQHGSRNPAEAIQLTSSTHGGLPGRRYVLSSEPNLHTPPSGIHQSSSGSSVVQHGSRNPAEAIQLTSSTHGGLVNLCHFTQLTALPPLSIARDVQKAPPLSPFCEIARSKTPDYLHATGWPDDDTMDNDTPAILRYSPAPMRSVKISSPNKKRISPPHNHLNDLRPISSGQLKSSRKYVFRSVPKFPPLSPCLDSKDPRDPPA